MSVLNPFFQTRTRLGPLVSRHPAMGSPLRSDLHNIRPSRTTPTFYPLGTSSRV